MASAPFGANAAAEVYNIPVVLPMTGSAAFLGKEESAALQVAETTVNKAGGISGRPIKFVIQDDQSKSGRRLTVGDCDRRVESADHDRLVDHGEPAAPSLR